MEIIIGKNAGFCYGVKRAINEVENELKLSKEINCLGEIIHNRNVLKKMKERGVKFIDNLDDINGQIVIRAHGASKDTYEIIKQKGIKIKDLTCPKVMKTHNIALEYSKKNYFIILIGIKNHPESIGTLSFCGENSYLLQEKEEIPILCEKIRNSKLKNVLIFAQTTFNSKKFDYISKLLRDNFNDINIEIQKTICGATEVRQNEAEQISKEVDVMIIVGDKKSSNTNKLYDISKENCKKVLFIQSSEELDFKEIKNSKKIGIMAGASTPKEDIDQIIEKIRGIYNE